MPCGVPQVELRDSRAPGSDPSIGPQPAKINRKPLAWQKQSPPLRTAKDFLPHMADEAEETGEL